MGSISIRGRLMTQLADLRGKWAIVTGASSGLGEEFARQLAAAGIHLVLVARRKDRLAATARDLMQAHGIQTRVISADLSLPDTPQMIYDQLRADGIAVDVLINNAGFGLYGKFTDIAWEREQQMLDVDIATVVRMTRLFVPDMAARKSAGCCKSRPSARSCPAHCTPAIRRQRRSCLASARRSTLNCVARVSASRRPVPV